jgi:hypothetical protein
VGRKKEMREGGNGKAVLSTFQGVGARKISYVLTFKYTVEQRLSGLIGKASHPEKQKIRIIGRFSKYRLHWQFEFRLLIFTACTCV